MLKQYSISDILDLPPQHVPYYTGTFEDTEDPEIEWPHRHSFYSLVWFTGGSGFYVVDFREYEIRPNRLFFVSPRQVHNWDYSENSKGFVLMVDATLAVQLGLESVVPYLDIKEEEGDFMKSLFSNLLNEAEKDDNLSCRNMQTGISYLYSFLARIANGVQADFPVQSPFVERLKRLVFENPQLLTVGEYAGKLHQTEESLNSHVKSSTGVSAKQYILDSKITEAKRLLLFSADNVNEIAYRLGFEDSSYFSRIFKKKTSLTPTDFLKKYRKQG